MAKRIVNITIVLIAVVMVIGGWFYSNKKEVRDIRRKIPEGQYAIAMITDAGNISDQSFNQTTYEACEAFAKQNHIKFVAKKPAKDQTEEKLEMVRIAVEEGYNIIVLPGYSFATVLVECAETYPQVKFVALDVSESDILSAALGEKYDADKEYDVKKYYHAENCYLVTYKEEQAGFMAGYAAVMMGYTKLGFVGGMEVPAVIRYGYGFISGANAAAVALHKENEVEVNYWYAGTFAPNASIVTECSKWYKQGTEVIFSCGGAIYTSVVDAANKYEAKIIGVDVDQAPILDAYREGTTITSAMKSLGYTVTDALESIVITNTWGEKAGQIVKLGLENYKDISVNYVQLADSTQWTESFDEAAYLQLIKDIVLRVYKISDSVNAKPDTVITVTYKKETS